MAGSVDPETVQTVLHTAVVATLIEAGFHVRLHICDSRWALHLSICKGFSHRICCRRLIWEPVMVAMTPPSSQTVPWTADLIGIRASHRRHQRVIQTRVLDPSQCVPALSLC